MSSLRVELVEEKHWFRRSKYKTFPSLMMARLAVVKDLQGHDYGSYLCDFAIANAMELRERLGCQFVIVNSKPDCIPFYHKNGFQLGSNQPKRREPFMYFRLPLPE